MKIGISLNMLAQEDRKDFAVYMDNLRLADLAEPLGFDSLFALEHHFTGYSMSPNPLQLLSYLAGRTKRITLGTSVIVLPWHDPIRVAEQIALLDVLSGGRCLFGFGRGAARSEYTGFGIPMEEARQRFSEAAQIVMMALKQESFEFDGQFYKIPTISIRPRPFSNPERRLFASSVSPESAELMAKLGFGMMVIMQNEWKKSAGDIKKYRQMAADIGHVPPPPIILTNVSCAESREEAQERARTYLGRKWDSIDAHYGFSDGKLGKIKGYEAYGAVAKTYEKLKDETARAKATDFYVSIQIVGTPDDCIQQIHELKQLTGMEHMISDFWYGGMPSDEAEVNLRLFADKVLPVVQRDQMFTDKLFTVKPHTTETPAHGDVYVLPA